MNEFKALKAKTCSFLTDDNDESKKTNGAKICVIKRKLNLKITKIV